MRPALADRLRQVGRKLRCWTFGHPADVPPGARACYRCSGWIKRGTRS